MAIFRSIPIQLAEGSLSDGWFQIFKTGTFYDERYGAVIITRDKFSQMIRNFSEGVRGIIPALDYEHETKGPAAGWFKQIEERNVVGEDAELWAKIETTPRGQKSLNEKEFAYLSPDYDEDYTDNENPNKKLGCVLLGAALTNRPVIKRMSPATQLSEKPKGANVKEEEMKKKLAEYEEQDKKLAEVMKMMEVKDLEGLKEKLSGLGKEKELAEDDKEKEEEKEKQLSESNKKILDLQKEVKKLAEENEKNKKEAEFTIMLSEGKAVPAQKEAFMKGDVVEFAKKAQSINLSERGHAHAPTNNDDRDEKVLKLANKKHTEARESGSPIQFSEALKIANREIGE